MKVATEVAIAEADTAEVDIVAEVELNTDLSQLPLKVEKKLLLVSKLIKLIKKIKNKETSVTEVRDTDIKVNQEKITTHMTDKTVLVELKELPRDKDTTNNLFIRRKETLIQNTSQRLEKRDLKDKRDTQEENLVKDIPEERLVKVMPEEKVEIDIPDKIEEFIMMKKRKRLKRLLKVKFPRNPQVRKLKPRNMIDTIETIEKRDKIDQKEEDSMMKKFSKSSQSQQV